MKLSVVIATYNRGALLERLLRQLAAQTLSPREFEVWVVDDGSSPPAREHLAGLELPYPFHLMEQENAGQAAARHAGALAARGEVLLFVDDDMQVGPDFLARHLDGHAGGERLVLLGRINPDPDLAGMPFFERWYADCLARRERGIREGRVTLDGSLLYTGNVSMRRADYLAAGGFDPALRQSEDCELGLRLEEAGVTFRLGEATTLHGSDHTSLEQWRRRASRYGMNDVRISRKHPGSRKASPWSYLFELRPLVSPFIGAAVLAPGVAGPVATAALRAVGLLDRLGLERPAFAGTTLAYTIEYFRGVRAELGSAREALGDLACFITRFEEGYHARALRWLA